MATFQSFIDRIISVLREDDVRGRSLIADGKLNKIYDGLPCFNTLTVFRHWVKDATLKHPQRRTSKQHQWLCIVDALEHESTSDIEAIRVGAADWLSDWEDSAYAIENLVKDPDTHYFFHEKHAITDAEGNEADFGESYPICTNDFDTDLHLAQRAPCGHHQCRGCFQESLTHAVVRYQCAFCRACLVCGTYSYEYHVVPREEAPPCPLDNLCI